MQLFFIKMQASGNDYIFLDCLANEVPNPDKLARALCKRRFSIGADGLIVLSPSKTADAKMSIFNADGSEAQMCGNASRCAGKLLFESNFARKSHISLETPSGTRDVYLTVKNGKIESISVDMGKATVKDTFIFEGIGEKLEMREINVGNDHQVAFVPDIDYIDFERLGPRLEKSARFPNGINTEFCEIVDKNHLRVRVFERGVGETLACGTGACAATICAIANGFCEASKRISVEMKGGNLTVFCDEMQRIWLSGNAQRVFEGIVEI